MDNKDKKFSSESDVLIEEKDEGKVTDSVDTTSTDDKLSKLIIPDIPEILKEKEVPRKKSKKGLIYGISAGAFVLMLVISILTTVLNRVEIAGKKYEKDVSSIYLFDCVMTQEDVETIGKLESLSYLQLKRCTLPSTDLSWLSSVTATVELEDCGLTDAHIAGIDFSSARFSSLDVDGNTQITDLSPLHSAKIGLTSLSFNGCNVSDISFLKGMTKLASLYFDSNKVTDISALSECTDLQIISFNSNKVSSLVPLSECFKLTQIYVNNNELSTLEGLESATGLTDIEANGNAINNISALANATSLKKVYINVDKNNVAYTNNGFSDLDCLINSASNLAELSMDGAATVEFSALEKFTRLQVLSVNNCSNFTTFTFLKNSKSLYSLSASHCSLTSLDGIQELNNINYLDVSYNNITSVDLLPDFKKNNVYVDLSNNFITSLVLTEQSYQNLAIYNNPIKELDLSKTKGFKLAIDYSDTFDYSAISGKYNSYYLIDCPHEKTDEFIAIWGKSSVSFVSEDEYRELIA